MSIKGRKDSIVELEECTDSEATVTPEKLSGISANMTLINLLKGFIGPGCFSLPLAFKNAGLWTGFFLVFVIGLLCTVAMSKMIKCSRYLMQKSGSSKPLDYGEMAAASFKYSFAGLKMYSKGAQMFVNSCLIILQLGVCSIFFIFVADHLQEILLYWRPNFHFPLSWCMMAIFIPFLLLSWVRSVRIMSYISIIGNVCMISSIVIIFMELLAADHNYDLPWITDFNGVIGASGAIIYSFEGQALILPLENRMKHPEEMRGWNGVLRTGLSMVTLVYVSSGFYGYVTYGKDVQGTITLNLPDNRLNLVVKVLLMLVMYSGYLIQLYPMVETIWPSVKVSLKRRSRNVHLLAHYALRSALFLIAVLFAVLVPKLENIIPLVGVTAGMMLALIIPAALNITTFLPDLIETHNWKTMCFMLAEDVLLLAVGMFFLVIGTFSNLTLITSEL